MAEKAMFIIQDTFKSLYIYLLLLLSYLISLMHSHELFKLILIGFLEQ